MTSSESFGSDKRPLQDLLKEIASGKMQLPDFQRGWVWDDDRIKSLIASISMSFPIGALMLLETGGEGVRFKPRPIEGTNPLVKDIDPETLILDGQQRLTSLYESLMGEGPVDTKDAKGKRFKRWYYLDMKASVNTNGDREEAVVSIPEDRKVKTFGGEITLDLSDKKKEFQHDHFPVNQIYESVEWRHGYNEYWKYDQQKMRLYDQFEREVIKRFERYPIPVIKLTKETPKEAVCLIFEKVNTGGVSLTVFELLTASFAADGFQLRDDWTARERRLKEEHPLLRSLQNDDFLQAVSLLVTLKRRREAVASGTEPEKAPGITCKRRDILKLTVEDYQAWAEKVEKGFRKTARFLHNQKIFRAKDLPYRTQIVPLASILIDLGNEAEPDGAQRKIARWYWSGVLGELYGGAIETRVARDLPEVVDFVRGKGEPITITDANFQAGRLLTLRSMNSAAYKGIYALLMRDHCCDFRTGEPIEAQTFFDEEIDIHHIFPKRWCEKNGLKPAVFNSIINKTAVSARTNRKIGGRAPSAYLRTLEKDGSISTKRIDEILQSHRIKSEHLRADDFWPFFQARAESLLDCIERATEKKVTRDPSLFRPETKTEEYEEGPKDWEEDEEGAVSEEAAAS